MILQQLKTRLARLLRLEDGVSAVEYAVLIALIVAVSIFSVQALANATRSNFDASASAIINAGN